MKVSIQMRAASLGLGFSTTLLPLAALTLAIGCGASDDDASVTPTLTPVPNASFAHVRDDILVPSCGFTTCHGAGSGGLTLTTSKSYAQLVDVASVEVPSVPRVAPGDPDNSYLMWKLEGAAGMTGDMMPQNGASLKASELADIRAWIAAGAKEN